MKDILLGFEVGTGTKVWVAPSHVIVTGVTQLSGKTTTLEALIKRGKLKSIVFKTKPGETGFIEGTVIPPHFKERSDWQYVSALLEATLRERLKFERSWIIRVCKNTSSLTEVKANIDRVLAEEKLRALDKSVFTTLQAYLELILPQLEGTTFSKVLTLKKGINVMDLQDFSNEIQSLVIRSVLETVLKKFKNTIVVIPEAWKFLPQKRGNPCKEVAEEFIRQGAVNGNYLWIDSQDVTGVDKTPLKQVSTWILGLQTEKNEVVRTLDQMPLPKRLKPKPDEIMTLEVGHFWYCSPNMSKKVYVQPLWVDNDTAKAVALGEIDVGVLVTDIRAVGPRYRGPLGRPNAQSKQSIPERMMQVTEQLFLNASSIGALDERIHRMTEKSIEISERVSGLEGAVAGLKRVIPRLEEMISKVSQVGGVATYEVAPLEKIQKNFLEETKQKILDDVSTLDEEQRKILKFVESQAKGCNQTHVLSRCLFLSATSGGTRSRISKKCKDMANLQLVRMDKNSIVYPNLEKRIEELLGTHRASEQEKRQVYDHILMELLA